MVFGRQDRQTKWWASHSPTQTHDYMHLTAIAVKEYLLYVLSSDLFFTLIEFYYQRVHYTQFISVARRLAYGVAGSDYR